MGPLAGATSAAAFLRMSVVGAAGSIPLAADGTSPRALRASAFAFALASPVCLCDSAAELVVAAQINVVKVQSVEKALLLDLPCKGFNLLLNVPLTHIGHTNQ
jgi:hypothetical protein